MTSRSVVTAAPSQSTAIQASLSSEASQAASSAASTALQSSSSAVSSSSSQASSSAPVGVTTSTLIQTGTASVTVIYTTEGVTLTSVQAVTITAPISVVTSSSSSSGGGGGGGLSSGAKLGIGVGVGVGAGAALLALLGFLLWRRHKNRVSDDFKWPELGDGTDSGGTAANLYPNPTHPTGNNRFNMDDEELFDEHDAATSTQHGSGSQTAPMMSERDPSFLSSAAGSAGGGYGGGNPNVGAYGGMAGLGAGAAAGAAIASSQHSHGRYPSQPEVPQEYYSQDGHSSGYSPPPTQYQHQQGAYQNYAGYDPATQQHHYYNPGLASGGGHPGGAALPMGAASLGLGRTGSIASTTAGGYQVGAMPEYGGAGEQDAESTATNARDRARNRNRLSVVNNLGDVGEE